MKFIHTDIDKTLLPQTKGKKVGNHRFYDIDGQNYPSVTSVTSLDSAEGIKAWRAKIGEKKAQEIVTEAANVGTVMHEMLEAWSLNEQYTGKNLLQAKMMAETVIKNVDDYLLRPLGEGLFRFNMQFNFDNKMLKGDLEVKAQGTES